MRHAFDFYETPDAAVQWPVRAVVTPTPGLRILCPAVGDGAIVDVLRQELPNPLILTNDIDTAREADLHLDATKHDLWFNVENLGVNTWDWVIENPPFDGAVEILRRSLAAAKVGVLMHLRGSFNEPLVKGPRRDLLRECPPTQTFWLPRWPFRESKKTGKIGTDSVTCCWMYWDRVQPHRAAHDQWPPDWVFDRFKAIKKQRADVRRRQRKEAREARQGHAAVPLHEQPGGPGGGEAGRGSHP